MKKLLLIVAFASYIYAANLHFSLFKEETGVGDTLLVIGGIHGNEPGGYFAPMILLKHYKISRGNLWIVPNLNFDSIVANQRGIYGDMNRKFAVMTKNDKDAKIVADIKSIILQPKVDFILNLHDGHGFYRPQPKNALFNPQAWGQAFIIDQQSLAGTKYGNLNTIAANIVKTNNKVILQEDVHEFNVKNTQTKDKDQAMRQSLTYFAVTHKKPAMAIETSKNIPDVPTKVLYQLKSLEQFMDLMGIKYTKDFVLNKQNVQILLRQYGDIEIPPSRITLPLDDLRPTIKFFPVNKAGMTYKSKNPLVALIKTKSGYDVFNGNIKVTTLATQAYDFDTSLKSIDVISDGKRRSVAPGSYVNFTHSFKIHTPAGYRVNVIGWSKPGVVNEADIDIPKAQLDKKYSLDKSARLYRVEIYKDKRFCGMICLYNP